MDFYNKGNLLVGITGAAFSLLSVETIMFIKENVCRNIKIVTTKNSQNFINEKALSYLTTDDNQDQVRHLNLTKWADVMIVLPATANTISKASYAIADNELLTSILAADCPIIFYPGMNINMWKNELFQQNIQRLEMNGYFFSYAIDEKLTLYNKQVSEPVVHPDITKIKDDIESVLS